MDFSHFASIPVFDSHIHYSHPELAGDLEQVMARVGYAAVNLLVVPHAEGLNQNPAVIDFKAAHPERTYISGALDYAPVWADPEAAAAAVAQQILTLKAIGFDGLKLIESKPTARKRFGFALDEPLYEAMWQTLEDERFPIVWHVADPEEFWDAEDCPDWARAHGWFYGDGTFPTKEHLYDEVAHVLERHPGLRVVFAHFYFLSANLPRASAFLEAHPNVMLDLTPGIEMYVNFARDVAAARAFFLRYAGRIVYGTDSGAGTAGPDGTRHIDQDDAVGRSRLVRQFLESDGPFDAPQELGHGLGMDTGGLHGIGLPADALAQIYHGNFQTLFGERPARLDRTAALAELQRMADGEAAPGLARQVLERMRVMRP